MCTSASRARFSWMRLCSASTLACKVGSVGREVSACLLGHAFGGACRSTLSGAGLGERLPEDSLDSWLLSLGLCGLAIVVREVED